MNHTKTRFGLRVTAVRAALLAHIAISAIPAVQADTERQRISFDGTISELGVGENRVDVHLTRCAGPEKLQEGLSVSLRVRSLAGAGAWTVSGAYFGPGNSGGVCTVRLAEGVGALSDVVGVVEVEESANIEAFARTAHCIRKKTAPLTTSGPVINAVVFSGAETPGAAVETVASGAWVVGGIVALGGTPLAPVVLPARLQPKGEYASGAWTPPLCPAALVLQFGPWKSNIAP